MPTSAPRKRFDKVNIEISNICNLQCGFCPEVVRGKRLIDAALFRKIIEQVAPITEQVAFHLMGDPLVHPDLEELVGICHEHSVRIFLVTNGVLMREKQARLLLHPAFRQVNFRLWNLADTRGTGARNHELLSRIESRFGVRVARDRDVRGFKSHHLRNRLYLHFDTEFTWPALELPILGKVGRCHGLSTHFGILVDGTVVPCCLDKEGAIPLGSVREQRIVDILESPRARLMLEGFRARKLVESLCQRCQYIERFEKRPEPQVESEF